MKKIVPIIIVLVLVFACSLEVYADCPHHGSQNITKECAGYPNYCEVRDCYISSHPDNCQTLRYNNYTLERCLFLSSTSGTGTMCNYQSYSGESHLCYVVHPQVNSSYDYCPF